MVDLPRERIAVGDVVLREWRERDADDVTASCRDPLTRRFLPGLTDPYTRDDALAWITRGTVAAWDAGAAVFAIADPETDRITGAIGLHRTDRGPMASVGYWVAPWARGRGVATRATRCVVSWGFEHGLHRVELITDAANEASQRVALGAGFSHEGVRRAGARAPDGTWGNRVIWVRVATDSGQPAARVLPDLPGGALSDGTVTLTPLREGDAEDLYALASLAEVVATTVPPVPPTIEAITERCARVGYLWLIGVRAEFAIRDAASGAFAGEIGLFHEAPTGQAMIGYSAARQWRGRGFTGRAVRLLADWAFDHAGIARLVAGAAPDNEASQRVLERAGFTREGYERGRLPGPGGTRIDNVSYALLPGDRVPRP